MSGTMVTTATKEISVDKRQVFWSMSPGKWVNKQTGAYDSRGPKFDGLFTDWLIKLEEMVTECSNNIWRGHLQPVTHVRIHPEMVSYLSMLGYSPGEWTKVSETEEQAANLLRLRYKIIRDMKQPLNRVNVQLVSRVKASCGPGASSNFPVLPALTLEDSGEPVLRADYEITVLDMPII